MAEVPQLKAKLNTVNRELVKLESDSIFMYEEKERRHLMAELEAWKLTKEDFKTELYAGLLPVISVCYEAVDALERFVNRNLDTRFEKLALKIADPDDAIGEFIKTENADLETHELVEGVQESDVKKRVLEKMVVMCKALLGEIKQELENSGRKTLAQWLQETEGTAFLPYEWNNLNELRLRAIRTGIELSQLLVSFVISLAGKEERLRRLQSKIESLTVTPKKCMVAEKFVAVMDVARDVMSEMKLKGELVHGAIEEEELFNKVVTQFFEAILDLDCIMTSLTVPETRRMVAGARMRLEDVLGQTLYSMQGLKLRVSKQNNESWKRMKVIIGELWKDMEPLTEKVEASGSVPEKDEGGNLAKKDEAGSVTQKDEAATPRQRKSKQS